MTTYTLFAPVPRGLEPPAADELRALGAAAVTEARAGVAFEGSLETALRACLWSRIASRVLLRLAVFPASTPEELYERAREIRWEDHLTPDATLAVDAVISDSAVTHSGYAALRVKDAVADRFRDLTGRRPSVSNDRPDIRINLRLHRDEATLSLDLSGDGLHRRSYREEGGEAPLKENLAAGILVYAKWPALAAEGRPLVDPMCGSGTLLIEGALLAADRAPGLMRDYFGFPGWQGFDRSIWERLLAEAHQRAEAGMQQLPVIAGSDRSPQAIAIARSNAERAGLAGKIRFEVRDTARLEAPAGDPGLVVVNPPYGARLGEERELHRLYAALGERLRQKFGGWKAALFTGNPGLAPELRIRPRRVRNLYNGPLECRLLHYDIEPRFFYRETAEAPAPPPQPLSAGGEMFANRLRKNLKTLGKWAGKEGVSCWRLYDADMPEYAVAVDLYGTVDPGGPWVHVQEYEAPKTVDPDKAATRLRELMTALPGVLDIPRERVFLKVRKKRKRGEQYEKLATGGEFRQVTENGCRFLVNFTDYLDTGLFLDHRLTRKMVGEMAQGKRFLNLFAYTGTATVYAARGRSVTTTTVDMSNTYLDWARRNLELNGFTGAAHRFVREDCLEWLERERGRYDLIFLDPPTFSTSKKMEGTFDVQRDQVRLLRAAVRLLAPGGTLLFSTNSRNFKIAATELPELEIRGITRETIPEDFRRNPKIHHAFIITRAAG